MILLYSIFAADINYVMFVFLVSVCYKDGVMENEPKPCAAVKGTQIMVSLDEVLLPCMLNTVGYVCKVYNNIIFCRLKIYFTIW
jgi:hypothetical protein